MHRACEQAGRDREEYEEHEKTEERGKQRAQRGIKHVQTRTWTQTQAPIDADMYTETKHVLTTHRSEGVGHVLRARAGSACNSCMRISAGRRLRLEDVSTPCDADKVQMHV